MKHLTLSIALLITAGAAQAGRFCELDGTEVFSCTFKDGTRGVEVCNAIWAEGSKVAYGFFKSDGTVEKEILQDMATLEAAPWNGLGAFMSESVTFDGGGGYSYEVWSGSERAADATPIGGINVLRDGALIADLSCDTGTVQSDLSGLIEIIEAAE